MTQNSPEVHAGPVVKVARDLTEIMNLHEDLQEQAISKANDRLMPGGLAMVALADVASIEAWSDQLEAAEYKHLADAKRYPSPMLDDEDTTWEPPLQTLLFWSEAWRTAHGYEHRSRPTLATETAFIRWCLDWAWDNEIKWEVFAEDVHTVRRRMENILKAGNRDIISDDVTCLVCETRLRRRMTRDGYEDEWWCIDCHNHLTPAQYNLSTSEAARRKLGLS